jgi:hypothetical protein
MIKEVLPSVREELVMSRIHTVRGHRVMSSLRRRLREGAVDSDLAELYQVETRVLNQAVRRNPTRFPADFMFALSPEEWGILTSQNVTSSPFALRVSRSGP